MKQINKNLLLIILMSMVGIKVFAYDIAVKNNDGVTIYYNYINNGKELAVAPKSSGSASYQDDVIYNIPQTVTIEGTEYPVTKIEESAFLKSKVVFLTIPEGIKNIGKDAFSQCAQLKSVKIPDSVTGELNCFYGCEMLTSIEIGENITKIGNRAFVGCKKLEKIVFPDKVAEVNVTAFNDCNSLTTLSFGSGISKFTYTSSKWQNCNSLNKIIIRDLSAWCRADFVIDSGANSYYTSPISKAGYIYSDENTRIKNLIIPNGISSIKRGSFLGCIGIESVTIPNSVTTVEDFAFYGSKNIKKIIFGKSVNYIGRDNFRECTNLGTIICLSEIPPSLYHESVFYESKNINLFVPKGCVSAYKESTWSSVAKNISELSSVTLDKHEVRVNAGETFQLNASIYPIYDINKPLVWTSSNEDVVTVDENGLVKAHKAGTAKVTTLLQSYMDTIDECEVTVIQPATGIQLSETKVTMSELGEMKQLVATVLPEDASNKAVTWMSSNPSVCSVTNNGTLVAMGYGTATIMATTVDGGFPAVCVVQVASYVVGDINGDDKVDVSDYTGIANFIHAGRIQ